MNGALHEAFKHNDWATKELLAFCRDLPAEKLGASAAGTYGDVLATFNHIVRSEAGYFRSLTGRRIEWLVARTNEDDLASLGELYPHVEELEELWRELIAGPADAERLIVLDRGTYEAHAGVIFAQVLNHGNTHREQICAILTGLGIQPPDIQAWAYGEATGRGRPRKI